MAVDQVSIIHVINSCKLQYIVDICSCSMYFCAFSEASRTLWNPLPTPFVSLGFVPSQCLGYVPHSNGLLHTLHTASSTVHTRVQLFSLKYQYISWWGIPVSTLVLTADNCNAWWPSSDTRGWSWDYLQVRLQLTICAGKHGNNFPLQSFNCIVIALKK